MSRVRSLNGVYLTSFTPQSIMASRTCVQECNRLRQQCRPDLPQYQLPPARSVKRKISASVAPQAKRPCRTNSCPTTCSTKRGPCGSECHPPPKVQKTIDTQSSDCFIVDRPQNQIVRQAFFFYPLDDAAQQSCCNLLRLNYHNKNIVSAGGPHIPLTAPDRSTLVDTVGDGSCMFRAMSAIITGNQRQHKAVRRAIVNHMCDNQHLYIHKVWLFDMQYPNMEAYVESNNMQQNGWGSQLELFALAHMLQRMVYTYTPHGGYHWACHCPSKVDPNIPPPVRDQGLYLFHTGDHYKVVTSVLQ